MKTSKSTEKLDTSYADKTVKTAEHANGKVNDGSTKIPAQPTAQKCLTEEPSYRINALCKEPRVYEEITTTQLTSQKQGKPATGQDGEGRKPIYGSRLQKSIAEVVAKVQRSLDIVSPSYTPSEALPAHSVTKAEEKPDRGTVNISAPTGGVKLNLDEIIDKTHRKSKKLLIVIIGVVIAAIFLLLGLGLVIYFVAREGVIGVITAEGLCQTQYGKCAIFAGKKKSPYPENCTQRIPCDYRCFYPTPNMDKIDRKHALYSIRYYVSGRNGLICGERSTCQDGICKVTANYAYDCKSDGKSAIDCIKSIYKINKTRCIHADRCHTELNYCQIRDQIRIGFRTTSSRHGQDERITAVRCGKPCSEGVGLPNAITWLRKKKCKFLHAGGCSYFCNDSKDTIHDIPIGTRCNRTRDGYCWRSRCFESQRFVPEKVDVELPALGKSCYGDNNGTRCYKRSTGFDCNDVHKKDLFGKAVTRYGRNCISWDTPEKVPKKYKSLGATGCILNDRKIPWCYSTNTNVLWNYCYNFCPTKSIYEKKAGHVRVMTFSYSAYADGVVAKQAARHFTILKADIIAINTWPIESKDKSGELMNRLIELLNSNISADQRWKLCGDEANPTKSKILLRGHLKGGKKTPAGTNNSVGCEVSMVNGKKFVVVATNVPNEPRLPKPDSCKCCTSGISNCINKRQIWKNDTVRRHHITTLLKAIKRDNQSGKSNILLTGNFGQPSHLDWTRATAHLHCNDTYSWSISKAIYDAGFKDSYRDIHNDASHWPGVTWSTLPSNEDTIYDRYDFQYYKGPSIKPIRAETYPAEQPSDALANSWPSNQYAVVVDYEIKL